MTTLHFVRHGQTTWNAERRLQGQCDGIDLTALGRTQAAEVAATLRHEPVVAVYSSDLRRAVETATPIATQHALAVRPMTALREQSYGVLEGQPTNLALRHPGYDLLDPDARARGGESIRDVYHRVAAMVDNVIAEHFGSAIILVSHSDTIRIAIAWLSGLGADEVPWREVPNGSITTIDVSIAGGLATAISKGAKL